MTDTTKFKSVGLDVKSYNKLIKICEHQRRNIRQQLGLFIDQEFEKEDTTTGTKDLACVAGSCEIVDIEGR